MICRNHLYSALAVLGFANGASDRVANSIASQATTAAILDMFGISLVAWGALGVAVWLFLQSQRQPAGRMDFVVSGIASIAFMLPVPQFSWIALTAIAVYLLIRSPAGPMSRGAAVLGALTIPMFWARLGFAAFSEPILTIDAKLVSWIVGTSSDANMIPFADGSGVLFLEPACSSLTNVSLALLCGVAIVKLYGLPWSATVLRAVFAAGLATVVINVARISAMAVLPTHYNLIHGPIGLTIAEWTTNLAVAAILAVGLRPDVPAHV